MPFPRQNEDLAAGELNTAFSYFGSWTVPNGQDPYRYHQGPGQIDEVYVFDVDGTPVVIDTAYYAGTADADVDDLRGILESATFQLP